MLGVIATAGLTNAIADREDAYVRLVDRLRDADLIDGGESRLLREAVELAGCLRRLVPNGSMEALHDAFGAPGDFGYDTPIGEALSRLYRGET